MSSHGFFELFPKLEIEQDLSHALEDGVVERVSTNGAHDALRIYLSCSALIPKRRIWKLEEEIRKQCFPGQRIQIRIVEKFRLSGQYNPKNLYEAYKDSIYEEIDHFSALLFGVFKKAQMEFDREDHLQITLEDTVIARERENDLHDILDKIFCERCGQRLIIDFSYRKPAKSRYREKSRLEIESEIAEISRQQMRIALQREISGNEAGDEKASETKPSARKYEKQEQTPRQRFQKKRAGRDRYSERRSSNPDVL